MTKDFNYNDMIWNTRINKQYKITKRNIRLLETLTKLSGQDTNDVVNHILDVYLFDPIRFKHLIENIFKQISDDEYDPETKRMTDAIIEIEAEISEKHPEIEEFRQKEVKIQ